MREILFRGKRIDNGEWVEGFYFREAGDFIKELTSSTHLVFPETVEQYTGLNDKNGTKIFEGDIISTDLKRPYLIVEYREACFMFNCNDGGNDYYDIFLPITNEVHESYKYGEVIGNIHDCGLNGQEMRAEDFCSRGERIEANEWVY